MNACSSPENAYAVRDAKRHRIKLGVLLCLFREHEILMIRRHQTGIDDGAYTVPIGTQEGNETALEALAREAQEEVGIVPDLDSAELIHTMLRKHTMPDGYSFEQLDLFFKVTHFQGKIHNAEPHKCDAVGFFALNHLPPETTPFVRHALEAWQHGINYTEFGFH
ncbi:MAG: hypothetical protein B7X06_01595 [Verrucomicrobia bacterium 21-51-4]|nr:MAG: hypothetical protein B7X06_01595 [Verrucomicrobia bacterium 21-51-4]HQU08632.1 NUDIX domain-containing protein [Opitutales bacterium]